MKIFLLAAILAALVTAVYIHSQKINTILRKIKDLLDLLDDLYALIGQMMDRLTEEDGKDTKKEQTNDKKQ